MNRLRSNSGFTLIELLVSCGLMIIVLSATLGALDVFGSTTATNQKVSDTQDQARNTLDRMSWELRNATAWEVTSAGNGGAVLLATPWDLIFKTVDPTTTTTTGANPNNIQRVRYCLDTTADILYRQVQVLTASPPPAMPTDANCPGTGWTTTTQAVPNVVNDGGRRVFTYNQQDHADVNAPTPLTSDISAVRAQLFTDINPGKAPAETSLASGVFLRNQNRRPTATCTASGSANGHVFLNGSASVDPEGGLLTYKWFDGTTRLTQTAANFDYVPATTGNHTFSLTVTDNSGLPADATCAPDPVNVQ